MFHRKVFRAEFAVLLVMFLLYGAVCTAVELPDEKSIQGAMDILVDAAPRVDEKAVKYAEKHVLKGMKNHGKGRYLNAIEHYSKALSRVPIYGGAYYELALTQYAIEKYPEAYANIVRALVIEPGMEMAHIVKASILDDAGHSERAIGQLKRLVDINPKSFLAWLNLGITQLKQDRFLEAERAFLVANQLDPNNPSTPYFLFICVARQGFSYEEEKWITKFLEIAPMKDLRRDLASRRLEALHSEAIYLDPESKQPELDLLEAMARRQWFLKRHRESYPSERGYRRSLEEEMNIAEILLSFAEGKSDIDYLQLSERIAILKKMHRLGYLKAYFYFELQDQLGEKDLRWAEENKKIINSYLAWEKTNKG